MEPLKINIEISLSDKTIDLLKKLLVPTLWSSPCISTMPPENVSPKAVETAFGPERQKAAPKTKTEKQPEPLAEETPEETPDDIPDGAMITDAELRQLTADAKNKSSAADIRAIFKNFDIKNSSACPIDKRPALKAELEKIIAA